MNREHEQHVGEPIESKYRIVAAAAAVPGATYVIASDLGPSLIEPLGSKDRTSFISMELGEVLDRYLAREQGLGIDRLRSYDMTRFKDD